MTLRVAITRSAAETGGGNQDFTSADLGGLTPKAAFFVITRATSDGTAAAHAIVGIGACTGSSNRWACSITSEDGQATTDTNRRGMTDECVCLISPGTGTVDGEADFNSFITNGVRITWGNNPADGYLITCILFAGSDLSAHADTFTGNAAQDGTTDITDPGFEPDLVLFGSHLMAFDDTEGSSAFLTHGVALNLASTEQYCWSFYEPSGYASGAPAAQITDNYAIAQVSTAGAIAWAGEIGSWDANGFSCTSRASGASGDQVGYLAINVNSAVSLEAGTRTSPTSTGNEAVATPGFTPQYVHLGLSYMPALDTGYSNASAGSLGIGCFDADDEFCNSFQVEDASGTTDTQSLSDDSAVNLPQDDGSAGLVATFVSMDANGWTLNWSTADGTGRQYWWFAIEQEAATTSTSSSTTTTQSTSTTTTVSTSTSTTSTSTSWTGSSTTVSTSSSTTVTTSTSTSTTVTTSTTTTQSTSTTITTSTSTTISTTTTQSTSTSTTTTLSPAVLADTALTEPRSLMYIESVKFTEPYDVRLIGGDDQRLETYLAQRGIRSEDDLSDSLDGEYHPKDRPVVTPYPPVVKPPGGTTSTLCTEGMVPVGGIIGFSGTLADLPNNWQLCDGTNGTPDLRDRFLVGAGSAYAQGDTGGADTVDTTHTHSEGTLATAADGAHTHGAGTYATDNDTHDHSVDAGTTASDSHDHTQGSLDTDFHPNHQHDDGTYITAGPSATQTVQSGTGINVATDTHVHDVTGSSGWASNHKHTITGTVQNDSHSHGPGTLDTDNDTHSHDVTGTSSSNGSHTHNITGDTAAGGDPAQDNRPQYYALAFIMKLAECTTSTSTSTSSSTSTTTSISTSSSTSTTTTLAP